MNALANTMNYSMCLVKATVTIALPLENHQSCVSAVRCEYADILWTMSCKRQAYIVSRVNVVQLHCSLEIFGSRLAYVGSRINIVRPRCLKSFVSSAVYSTQRSLVSTRQKHDILLLLIPHRRCSQARSCPRGELRWASRM